MGGDPNGVNPDIWAQAMQQYPAIRNLGINHVITIQPNHGYLEYWPPGETGAPDFPRPKDLPANAPGLQILRQDTKPADVAGDITSHYLVSHDPVIKQYYHSFVSSLTDSQRQKLKDDYKYAQDKEGEKRPFNEWATTTRLPAYFRGYAFQQWPQSFNDQFYTKDQKSMFDNMMKYLRGQK